MDIIDIDRIEKCYQEDFGVTGPAENVLPGKEYVDLYWETTEVNRQRISSYHHGNYFYFWYCKNSPVEIIKLSYPLHISTTSIGSIPFRHNV